MSEGEPAGSRNTVRIVAWVVGRCATPGRVVTGRDYLPTGWTDGSVGASSEVEYEISQKRATRVVDRGRVVETSAFAGIIARRACQARIASVRVAIRFSVIDIEVDVDLCGVPPLPGGVVAPPPRERSRAVDGWPSPP